MSTIDTTDLLPNAPPPVTFTDADPSPSSLAFGAIVAGALPLGVTATVAHSIPRALHDVVLTGPRGRTRVTIGDALAADSPAAVVDAIKHAAQYIAGGGS